MNGIKEESFMLSYKSLKREINGTTRKTFILEVRHKNKVNSTFLLCYSTINNSLSGVMRRAERKLLFELDGINKISVIVRSLPGISCSLVTSRTLNE